MAVDGTVLKAINNTDRNFRRASLGRFIREADERLADYMRRLDGGDVDEGGMGGGSHPRTVSVMVDLADMCLVWGSHADAEPLLREVRGGHGWGSGRAAPARWPPRTVWVSCT